MLGLFRRKPPRNPAGIARVKAGVVDLLGLGEHDTIMLAQLRRHNAGCSDSETLEAACADRRRLVQRCPTPMVDNGREDFTVLSLRAGQMRTTTGGHL